MRFRISRPCWDKPHRCPGWAGGGNRFAKVQTCDNGRISTKPRMIKIADFEPFETDHPGSNPWRMGKCNTCNVITIPWALRHVDPRYWKMSAYLAWRRLSDWYTYDVRKR
jgi:hypothetical protein